MRYATVVAQRLVVRLLDDWHQRRGRVAGSADARARRLGLGALISVLVRQLLTISVVSVRALAVAAPPVRSSGLPLPADDSGHLHGSGEHLTPATPGSATSVDEPHAPPTSIVRAAGLREPRPYRPGAHPTPAALFRGQKAHAAGGRVRRGVASIEHFGDALIQRLWPIRSALATALTRSGTDEGAPVEPSRSTGISWAAQQRLVGGAVAALVLAASIVGVSPVHTPDGGIGNVDGGGITPRIAIGGDAGVSADLLGGYVVLPDGGLATDQPRDAEREQAVAEPTQDAGDLFAASWFADAQPIDPSVATQDIEAFSETPDSGPDGSTTLPVIEPEIVTESTGQGAFLADGTILKPIAVDTTVPDARSLLTTYTVRKGDTLTGIASRNGISMVTLYWANHLTTNLTSKSDLKIGQQLSIPPVNGVLHIVTDKETLAKISKATGVPAERIIEANGLTQETVFVGQWLILPGAKAKPIPEEPAPPKPSTSSGSASQPARSAVQPKPVIKPVPKPPTTGGGWSWPAPGGYISQYYRYGHWGLDIASDYGASVRAAKSGVVIFAGWKSNGGGYQVWISHGGGIYSTYNHMSAIAVGNGQSVGAGQQVGRIGSSGHSTGPHLHFEVWRGSIWNGGSRVNPLSYI